MSSKTRARHFIPALSLFVQIASQSAVAAPGDLDASFGIGGKVTTDLGTPYDTGVSVAMQSDGKTVVAGYTFDGSSSFNFALARYTGTGALDASFGSGGKVVTDFSGPNERLTSMALQSDGKIVVAGFASNGSNNDFALVRYNTDGTLDPTFGSGGKVITPVGSGNDSGNSVVLQSNGKIVVAGSASNGSNNDIALVCYNTDGTLDPTFGSGGKVITPVGSGNDSGNGVALQSDGKIVVAGSASNGSNNDIALVRYNTDGTLDPTFGSGGKVTTPIGSSNDYGKDVTLQSDGKIIVAGYSDQGANGDDFALVRYNTDGMLDSTFGSGGKVVTPVSTSTFPGSNNDRSYAVAVQADGKILEAGVAWDQAIGGDVFALVRLTSTGVLDSSFGIGGKVTTSNQGDDFGYGVALQIDGKIVVAGQSYNAGAYDFGLTRYEGLTATTTSQSGVLSTGDLIIAPTVSTAEVYSNNGNNITATNSSLIGFQGVGVMNHEGGMHNTAWAVIGNSSQSQGTYNLSSGSLTVTNAAKDLRVGNLGRGALNQTGGSVTAPSLWINAHSPGNLCAYNQSAGTADITGGIFLAQDASSGAEYNLNGGSVTAGTNLSVGMSGTGAVHQSGGTLSVTQNIYLATTAAGTGIYNAYGGSVSSNQFVIGQLGSGVLNVDGGSLTCSTLKTGTGTPSLTFSKGTVTATSTNLNLGAGGVTVGNGVDTATLVLGNGTHTIAGGVHVPAAGKVTLSGSSASSVNVDMTGNGRIDGAGTMGSITASGTGNVGPGSGAAIIHCGSLNLSGSVSYTVDLAGAAGPGAGGNDCLVVTGSVTLNNALIPVLSYAPAIGQVFLIIDNDGADAVSGTFVSRPQGYVYTLTNTGAGGGTYKARLSYQGGTGNDVTLTIIDVPAVTLAATTNLTATGVTLNGTVNANGGTTTALFEYGTTLSYGNTASVTLSPNDGTTAQNVSANLSSLAPGTLYHYRLTATNGAGTTSTSDGTFTTLSSNANLSSLTLSTGALNPSFSSGTTDYTATVPYTITSITVTPTAADSNATITVNGNAVPSGSASDPLVLNVGSNTITTLVTAQDAITTSSYSVTVTRAIPNPGDLDFAFGSGGKVTMPIGASTDRGQSVEVQSDGKIIVAGYSFNGSNFDFALVRYTSTGTLDAGFGSGGKVTTPIGIKDDIALDVAIQTDGKIVVAGYSDNGINNDFALVRYNTDGTLDPTFGSGGKVITPVGSGNDSGNGVAIQTDGKIVVAGYSDNGTNNDFALVRYNTDGTLDPTFGSGGKVITPVGSGNDSGNGVALQSDGKIVVAGYSRNGSNFDFALVRYNDDGTLDTSFGNVGKVTTAIGTGDDLGLSVVLKNDGKIIVAGYASYGSNADFALVRYNIDGTLDSSFGAGGKITTAIGSGNEVGTDVVVQSDGRIVVAGYSANGSNGDFALVRYTDTGALDTSYGTGGKATTDLGNSDDYGQSLALQSDGKIVVAGFSHNIGATDDFALVRYNNALAPAVQVLAASNITITNVNLNGSVNPNGATTTAQFEYGTDTNYGSTASVTLSPSDGTIPQSVSASLTGLTPGTTYHYRLTATNVVGTSSTGDLTFTTPLAVPLSGGDDFNDGSADPAKWTADRVHAGGTFVEANGRLEYRVTNPDMTLDGYDEVLRPWIMNAARNTDAFDVVLDAVNNTSPTDANNASVGLTVTSLENPQDSLFIELYHGGPSSDGTGFLAAMTSHEFGGNEVDPATLPTNHPAVTTASVRISYDPVKMLFTTWYDATGSADGFQWQPYGSFGVGPSGGGIRNSAWALSQGQGFQISVSGFSEGMVINGGEVYADNFQVGTGIAGWRLATFGTANPSGSFADDADPDHDDIVNLLEFALGTDPQSPGHVEQSLTPPSGGNLQYRYTRSVAALDSGFLFIVEWSDTMASNDWHTSGVTEQVLSDNGTVQQVKATIPAGSSGRRFVRLKVTGAP